MSFVKNKEENATKDENEKKEKEKQKSGKKDKPNKSKLNPLLNAKTEAYVDDTNLYNPRTTVEQRLTYWSYLLDIIGSRPLPSTHIPWIAKEITEGDEYSQFPSRLIYLFHFIKSRRWDQIYLDFLILWILLIIYIAEGVDTKFNLNLSVYISLTSMYLFVPPILMLLTQLIPILGILFYVHFCNDLVHFFARKSFAQWSFCSVLLAQYIEYFYYGGRDRRDRAGECGYISKKEKKVSDNNSQKKKGFFSSSISLVGGKNRHAKVHDIVVNQSDSNTSLKIDRTDDIEKNLSEVAVDNNEKNNDNNSNNNSNSLIVRAMPKAIKSSKKKKTIDFAKLQTTKELISLDKEDEKKAEEIELEDEEGVDYSDWTCIVCGKHNHERAVPREVESDLVFKTKGIHYQRTYVLIKPQRPKPKCRKCYTYIDYIPPLATAHQFPRTPHPFAAFEKYPPLPRVQAKFDKRRIARVKSTVSSFFFGLRNYRKSRLIRNDWKLKKYAAHILPEMFRFVLRPGELYEPGEIVECSQQKADWFRAQIMFARADHSYDIKYEMGDEVRFVLESAIRSLPEKKRYAYRVELGMVVLVVLLPISLMMALYTKSIGMVLIGPLVVSAVLLIVRFVIFIQYLYNFYDAGCYQIFTLTLISVLPMLFLAIASATAITNSDPSKWLLSSVLFIISLFMSLLMLYLMKPSYFAIGLGLFLLFSVSLILLCLTFNNSFAAPYPYAISFAPMLIMLILLKYLRQQLHNIWDTCLIVRPERIMSDSNPSIWSVFFKYCIGKK